MEKTFLSSNAMGDTSNSSSNQNEFAIPERVSVFNGRSNTLSGRNVSSNSAEESLYEKAARLGLTSDTDKFMLNFNPENSNREKRKLTRKLVQSHKRCYDNKGILIIANKDLCDCLFENCPGCFFPCPKCRSCKCGHECRQNRKWIYESVEYQGAKKVIHNIYRNQVKKKPS